MSRLNVRSAASAIVFCAAALVASSARPAAAQSLFFVPVESGAVRVDGALREYRDQQLVQLGRSSTSAMRYFVGYDAEGLYVAARVDDERLIRTSAGGRADDAVVLTIASPGARGWVASEVWLNPGVTGSSAGAVLVGAVGARLRPAGGARIVEAPRDGGYQLEAFIPFSAIPGAGDFPRARAAIRLHDVDASRGTATEHASAVGAPDTLPRVRGGGGELATLAAFLEARGVDDRAIAHDLRADVAGDEREERVVIAAGHVAVMGSGYLDGRRFDFSGLGALTGRGLLEVALSDLTGDGKSDLYVETEERGPEGMRRIATVYSMARGRIEPLVRIPFGVTTADGSVEGAVAIQPDRRGPARIVVQAGEAAGLDPARFRFQSVADVEPLLLPWGPIASRTYSFDGRDFAVSDETPNRAYRAPVEAPSGGGTSGTAPPQAAPPRRPTVAELISAARSSIGIPASVPARFEGSGNLAEGPTAERYVLVGRTLIVVGPDFRGGVRYFHSELPAAAEDLLSLSSVDLDGDGREELLVRMRQALSDTISREVLLVQRFTRCGFQRALAVEVMRTDGTNRVQNDVRTTRGQLVIEPGRPQGWTQQTWPFGGFADDGVAPLLLPWQDRAVRYGMSRGVLVAR